MPTVESMQDALRQVIDPELGLDIVTLGLVYDLTRSEDGAVDVQMTMTSRGCPMQGIIAASAKGALQALPEVSHVTVDVVWEPAWTPDRIAPEGRAFLGM